jgi:hypothetical protein
VTPIHVQPFAWRRLDADVGAPGDGALAQCTQIILDDGEAPVVSMELQTLSDHRSIRVRVLLQQFGDDRFEWIELAGAIPASGLRGRRIQILGDRATADAHLPRDLTRRPLLHKVKAV